MACALANCASRARICRVPLWQPQSSLQPQPFVNQWTIASGEHRTVVNLGAEDPAIPADWPYGSGRFAWPTYGWLTQGHSGHSGARWILPLPLVRLSQRQIGAE